MRNILKANAKKRMKLSYWSYVAVCFLLAFFAFEYNSSVTSLRTYRQSNSHQVSIQPGMQSHLVWTEDRSNFFKNIVLDSNELATSNPYLFKFAGVIKNLVTSKYQQAIYWFSAFFLTLGYSIFFAYPFTVGSRKFFLEAKEKKNVPIHTTFAAFQKEAYLNTVKIMLLKAIYTLLWTFTIVGGIIKSYEYRMIPYILAEDPTLSTKEVFQRSKILMTGKKWTTFVIDLSFFGWNILNIFTFGLSGILFSNPYHAATITEWYQVLKKDAQ